jgi:HK97 family phage major capsid protein
MQYRDLINLRNSKVGNLKVILANSENRELTPEEMAQLDDLKQTIANLTSRIEAVETAQANDPAEDQDAIDAAMADDSAADAADDQDNSAEDEPKRSSSKLAISLATNRRANPVAPTYVRDLNDRKANQNRDLALRGWAMQGVGAATDAHHKAARSLGFNLSQRSLPFALDTRSPRRNETRAQATTSDGAGGVLVPRTLKDSLEKTLLYFAEMRNYAQVLRTATGNNYDMPVVNDTGNSGEIISENSQYNSLDATFSKVTLGAYKYTSKLVNISIELLQDSAIDVPSMLGELLGERLGRIQASHFATGNGTSQPQGLITGASAGVTAASATAIAVDDLLGLVHSLDRAYRPSASFVMSDSVLLAIRKLKDSYGRPIFTESYIVGEPDRLFSYPIVINNYHPTSIATGAKTVVFGDLSRFVVRDALDVKLVRLDERFADLGQVAFVAIMRTDAKVLVSSAVKLLTQA